MGAGWVLRGWALMITRKAGLVGSVAALPVIAGAIQFVQRSDRAKLYLGIDVRLDESVWTDRGSIVRGAKAASADRISPSASWLLWRW